MSSRKDDPQDWATPQDGSTVPGEEFDPTSPESPESGDVPARRAPVSHGTPVSREVYERWKDEAERDRSPSGADAQIDPSAC